MARRRREPKIRNPFNYGDLVTDESFTDRQDELKQLKSDIVNGQNVALIAPRRYGKSSLVRAALSDLIGQGVLVVEVDLMATPTKERLAGKLAKSIDSDIAPTVFKAKEHLRIFQSLRVAPIVTVDPDGSFSFSFSASRAPEEIDDTLERLLELPAIVAADKRKHVVVYFDEFQEITEIDARLPALMRSVFQQQQHVSHAKRQTDARSSVVRSAHSAFASSRSGQRHLVKHAQFSKSRRQDCSKVASTFSYWKRSPISKRFIRRSWQFASSVSFRS